jgi:hypothetical protein
MLRLRLIVRVGLVFSWGVTSMAEMNQWHRGQVARSSRRSLDPARSGGRRSTILWLAAVPGTLVVLGERVRMTIDGSVPLLRLRQMKSRDFPPYPSRPCPCPSPTRHQTAVAPPAPPTAGEPSAALRAQRRSEGRTTGSSPTHRARAPPALRPEPTPRVRTKSHD